jgi:hypothetical protein
VDLMSDHQIMQDDERLKNSDMKEFLGAYVSQRLVDSLGSDSQTRKETVVRITRKRSEEINLELGNSENPNSKEVSLLNASVLDPFVMGHNLVGSSIFKEKEVNAGEVAQLQKALSYCVNFVCRDKDTVADL